MDLLFTAVFQKVSEGYIAFVEELPGANTQGRTLQEARANLREAIQLVLEANRMLSEDMFAGQDVIREPLRQRFLAKGIPVRIGVEAVEEIVAEGIAARGIRGNAVCS